MLGDEPTDVLRQRRRNAPICTFRQDVGKSTLHVSAASNIKSRVRKHAIFVNFHTGVSCDIISNLVDLSNICKTLGYLVAPMNIPMSDFDINMCYSPGVFWEKEAGKRSKREAAELKLPDVLDLDRHQGKQDWSQIGAMNGVAKAWKFFMVQRGRRLKPFSLTPPLAVPAVPQFM